MLRSSRFGGSGLLALLAVAYLSKSSPIPLPRPRGSLLQSQQHLRALDDMAGAGSNGEALASRMEIIEMIIEMNGKLRSRQEIVNGLSIFLEENGIEEETSLEELEEESDVFEEEESEGLREDGPKEAHDNVRTSHKVSLRSITSMTDEERFNMRIKKFGMNTSKEFRKSPGASCFGLRLSTGMDCHHFQFGTSAGKENADMEKKRRRLARFRLR